MSCENLLLQLIQRASCLHQSCRVSVGSCPSRTVGCTMGRGWEIQELFSYSGPGRGETRCSSSVFKQLLLQELPKHMPAPDLRYSLVPLQTKLGWTFPVPVLSCSWLPVWGSPITPQCHHCLTPQLPPAQLASHITWHSFLYIYNCYSRNTFLQFSKLLTLTVTCVRNAAALTRREQCWSACLNVPTTPGVSQESVRQYSLVALCTFCLETENTSLFMCFMGNQCIVPVSQEALPGLCRKWIVRCEQGLGHTSFSASSFRAPSSHQMQPLLLLRKGLLHKVDHLLWLALPAVSPALCFVLQEHTWQQVVGYPADSEDYIQLFC